MRQLIAESATSVPAYVAASHMLRIVPLETPREPAPEYVIERENYTVRVIRSSAQRARAGMLVERMYSWRGYHTDGVAGGRQDSSRITFEASSESQLFGTLTLGLDSEDGLLADTLYEDEIDPFRRSGGKVCELSKFAVDPQHSSKEVMASLIQLAHIHARILRQVTDAFIEVNPRHALFYERMLGFRQIGTVRTCPRVDAPAVLLHLELAYMDEQIRKHTGSFDSRERSLYPYFLSIREGGTRGSSSDSDRIAQAA